MVFISFFEGMRGKDQGAFYNSTYTVQNIDIEEQGQQG